MPRRSRSRSAVIRRLSRRVRSLKRSLRRRPTYVVRRSPYVIRRSPIILRAPSRSAFGIEAAKSRARAAGISIGDKSARQAYYLGRAHNV